MTFIEVVTLAANIATAFSFVAGLWFFLRQTRHQTKLSSAQILISLNDVYHSEAFRKNRVLFARKMKRHIKGERRLRVTDHTRSGSLFEDIAYLANTGAIDIAATNSMFGWAIFNFYTILRNGNSNFDFIASEKHSLSDAYKEIEDFATQFAAKHPEVKSVSSVDEYIACELALFS